MCLPDNHRWHFVRELERLMEEDKRVFEFVCEDCGETKKVDQE